MTLPPSIRRAVLIHGDVTRSLIITGDNNQVILNDNGLLAQRWLAWQGAPEEARRAYLETLAALHARHTFPLSKLSFQAVLGQVYQPPRFARYAGAWSPSLRRARHAQPLEEVLSAPSPAALTGAPGEGKSTALRRGASGLHSTSPCLSWPRCAARTWSRVWPRPNPCTA